MIAVIGFGAVTWFSRDPMKFQGKSLDYWIERAQDERLRKTDRDEAHAAVFQIATNNLPVLLEWFCREEPDQSEPAYIDFINKILEHQKLLGFR